MFLSRRKWATTAWALAVHFFVWVKKDNCLSSQIPSYLVTWFAAIFFSPTIRSGYSFSLGATVKCRSSLFSCSKVTALISPNLIISCASRASFSEHLVRMRPVWMIATSSAKLHLFLLPRRRIDSVNNKKSIGEDGEPCSSPKHRGVSWLLNPLNCI